ncbi:pbs lyase heat domain protein repeat-containing protein : Uncharacterized protein OS=Lyngbya sp. (strain PCC 8106) GN=L8106_11777 PE=4 SV=1: HEAT_2 [Gemmataceae bacterium]|nr:pbs lyase heat domain protein repeat-containing protein : Uncharacterized protein OS=Lyngbya sp. (strain PCC 8106) GN=L8106_11777 PE=4 SV=1: HEAT_2 [Gemmataceae bacterium]VTU00108.1 pbs lyase heat domain protein repeat-containing protein : Uncharacterized protein OS=Lyngbya sp. (strain PCC 8106) GN=L8106_11777 PE=4 SV=1: HEAT_2 [Gemmataceae bacterium]
MGIRVHGLVALCLVAFCGCAKREKTTAELIADLKSTSEHDRLVAVRLLPDRRDDAATVVPALAEALKDAEGDVRRSAAIGLGSFAEQAREAIPSLKALRKDHDARVRDAAGKALARIDPGTAPRVSGR